MRSAHPTRTAKIALAKALALAATLVPAALAQANQMTVFSCHDPAGNTVGHDGWSMNRTADLDMYLADTCAAGGQGALTLELAGNGAGYANAARAEWIFNAPAWASISTYTIDLADSYAIPSVGAGSGQVFVDASDESDPLYDYRNLGSAWLGPSVIRRTPPAPVSWIDLNASCDGQYGPCASGVRVSRLDAGGATVVLRDSTTPTVSALSGSLTSGGSVTGTGEVSFDAADAGPGVYSAQLTVDGAPHAPVLLDSNDGRCVDLGQTTDGTRSFAHPDPCAQSTSGTLNLDTTTLADGAHAIKLTVDDASGNATLAYDGTLSAHNAPLASAPPSVTAEGPVNPGTVLIAQPGVWSAPAGAGSIGYAYQWQDCDTTGGSCSSIPGAQAASYTLTGADVGHTLRVLVNASDNDGTTVAASPTSASVTAVTAAARSSEVAGMPNGLGASETARLTVAGPRSLLRRYQNRAFVLTGRLTAASGDPIVGATLDLLVQSPGSPMHVIGGAVSRSDGTFTVRVPPGPSRIVEVAYRAISSDAGYAATGQVSETVAAGVALSIAPHRTTADGTIALTAAVAGPVPRGGVIVVLLVRYRGRWEPFRTPRTDRRGHFTLAYQFQGALGRFPFRAEVPAGQAGLPYGTGYSAPVSVSTD